MEGLELGLVLWDGAFEGMTATWLRWCDKARNLLPTATERAERLKKRSRDLGHELD